MKKTVLLLPALLLSLGACSFEEETSTSSFNDDTSLVTTPSFVAHDLEVNQETFTLLNNELDQTHKMKAGAISTSKEIITYAPDNTEVSLFKGYLINIYPNAFSIEHANKKTVTKNHEKQPNSFKANGIEEVLVDDSKVLYISNFKKDDNNVADSTANSTNPIGYYTTSFKKSILGETEFKKKQNIVYNYLMNNAKSVSKKDRLLEFITFYSENKDHVNLTIHAPFEHQYLLTMTYKIAQEQEDQTYLYAQTTSTLKITDHNIINTEDISNIYSDPELKNLISKQIMKYNVSINDIPTNLKEPTIPDNAEEIPEEDYLNFYSLKNYFVPVPSNNAN